MSGVVGIAGAILGIFVAIVFLAVMFPVLETLGLQWALLFLVLAIFIIAGAVLTVLRR